MKTGYMTALLMCIFCFCSLPSSAALHNEPADSVSTDEMHKFLMEIPADENVEDNECWNEQLFKYLEQGNFAVIDLIDGLEHDLQARILDHLRNPIHDGINMEKLYMDIKAARPHAQVCISAIFDGMRKNHIRSILDSRHTMRTVSYTSPDGARMRHSDKTRKGNPALNCNASWTKWNMTAY